MITPFYICTREVSGSGVFLAHQIQAFFMITQKMKIRMRMNLLSQVRIISAMIGTTRFFVYPETDWSVTDIALNFRWERNHQIDKSGEYFFRLQADDDYKSFAFSL